MKRFSTISLLALMLAGPAHAQDRVQAGVAGPVLGQVQLQIPNAQAQPLRTGAAVHLGDSLATGPDARTQLLLLDETSFTMGPNSELVIDEFIYAPDTDTSALTARFTKGVFRYVSGQIAATRRDRVQLKLPVGVIGIRGTSILVSEDPDTPGGFVVVLLGPGLGNSAAKGLGGLIFTGNEGRQNRVFRSGHALFIDKKGQVEHRAVGPQFLTGKLRDLRGRPHRPAPQRPGPRAGLQRRAGADIVRIQGQGRQVHRHLGNQNRVGGGQAVVTGESAADAFFTLQTFGGLPVMGTPTFTLHNGMVHDLRGTSRDGLRTEPVFSPAQLQALVQHTANRPVLGSATMSLSVNFANRQITGLQLTNLSVPTLAVNESSVDLLSGGVIDFSALTGQAFVDTAQFVTPGTVSSNQGTLLVGADVGFLNNTHTVTLIDIVDSGAGQALAGISAVLPPD